MKGIKLEGDYQERAKQINNFIVELGGKRVRRKRNVFSGKLEVNFSSKRCGCCHPSSSRRAKAAWDEQPCFGFRTVNNTKMYGGYEEENRIFMKANSRYDIVSHYTLVDCRASCYHEAIVVCVRELKKTGDVYMLPHIAGKCPYCTYFERY
jgi:hypothetical protein